MSPLLIATAEAANIPPPNYSTDRAANFAAADVAEALDKALSPLSTFAGVMIDPAGITIREVGDDQDLRSAAALALSIGGDVIPLTYVQVSRSMNDLAALTKTLDDTQATWATEGVALTSWGPDVTSNTVLIHVAHYSADVAAKLTAAYGNAITIDPEDYSLEPANRTADSAPWWGADQIKRASGSTIYTCTSWFTTYDQTNGYNNMLTAGHCGAGDWTNNGNSLATVASGAVHWGGEADTEASGADGGNSPNIWTDPNTAYRVVTSVGSRPASGTYICTDGQTDRERCDVVVTQADVSVTYGGKTLTHQVAAGCEDGHAAFSGGDSGAPVYATPSDPSVKSNVKAYGMLTAQVSGAPCNGDFTPVSQVLDAYNAVITLKEG